MKLNLWESVCNDPALRAECDALWDVVGAARVAVRSFAATHLACHGQEAVPPELADVCKALAVLDREILR